MVWWCETMSDPVIELRDIHAGYHGDSVLRGVSFAVERGSFGALIGPNGGGKTTLLRVACRILRPYAGEVLLSGLLASSLRQVAVAKLIGFVPQATSASFEFSVEEAVLMGRYPHLEGFRRPGRADLALAEQAMEATGTLPLRDRLLGELSGGEFQRVILARSLAQQPAALVLDEPTAHLDLAYQAEVLDLLRRLNGHGLTILAVLHDLNLAVQYFDHYTLLSGGQILAQGGSDDVLRDDILSRAYGAAIAVERGPGGRVVRVYARAGNGASLSGIAGRDALGGQRKAPATLRAGEVLPVKQ